MHMTYPYVAAAVTHDLSIRGGCCHFCRRQKLVVATEGGGIKVLAGKGPNAKYSYSGLTMYQK
jgi:hypothetical protein